MAFNGRHGFPVSWKRCLSSYKLQESARSCSSHDDEEALSRRLLLVPLVTLTAATGERFHEIQNAGIQFQKRIIIQLYLRHAARLYSRFRTSAFPPPRGGKLSLSLRSLLSGAEHTLYGWCHAGEDSSPP